MCIRDSIGTIDTYAKQVTDLHGKMPELKEKLAKANDAMKYLPEVDALGEKIVELNGKMPSIKEPVSYTHLDWVRLQGKGIGRAMKIGKDNILGFTQAVEEYLAPVSYTHLDVYKRQDLSCRTSCRSGNPSHCSRRS